MESLFVTGFLLNTNIKEIKEVLSQFLTTEKLKNKTKIIGDELNYADAQIELFVYSENIENFDDNNDNYLIQGECFESMKKLQSLVDALAGEFLKRNIKFNFEIYAENNKGEQIGDAITVIHPDL